MFEILNVKTLKISDFLHTRVSSLQAYPVYLKFLNGVQPAHALFFLQFFLMDIISTPSFYQSKICKKNMSFHSRVRSSQCQITTPIQKSIFATTSGTHPRGTVLIFLTFWRLHQSHTSFWFVFSLFCFWVQSHRNIGCPGLILPTLCWIRVQSPAPCLSGTRPGFLVINGPLQSGGRVFFPVIFLRSNKWFLRNHTCFWMRRSEGHTEQSIFY